jgi:hypothetical protein
MHRTRSVFPRATKRPAAPAPTIDATALRQWIGEALRTADSRRDATNGAARELERLLSFGTLRGSAKRVVVAMVGTNHFATERQWGATMVLYELRARFFPNEPAPK